MHNTKYAQQQIESVLCISYALRYPVIVCEISEISKN